MAESIRCPECNGSSIVTKQVHVHPDTGKELRAATWIGGGIALIVLALALNFAVAATASQPELMPVMVVGMFASFGGFVAAYVVLRRYRRAPLESRLICKGCRNRWKADAAARAVRQANLMEAGEIILPFKSLPPGVYGHGELGLAEMDTCVYCGEPSSVQLPHKVTSKGKKAEAADSWTFSLSFGLCEKHVRTDRRNSIILVAAFAIGALGGIWLIVAMFAADPEGYFTSVAEVVSTFLPEGWMRGLGTMVFALAAPVFYIVICGSLVMFAVRLAAGTAVKTIRDQRRGGLLGVGFDLDTSEKQLKLSFSRPVSAATFATLNETAIQSLTKRAEAATAAEALAASASARAARRALVIAAAEAKADFGQAEEACWFCERGAPADGTPHSVVLFKGTGEARQEQTIWVPRCAACEATHKKDDPLTKIVLPVTLVLSMGGCVLIGVAGSGTLKAWGWVIGAIVSLVVFGVGVFSVQRATTKRAEAAGTRLTSSANLQHEDVAALMKDKWRIDATKTGKAAT